MSVKVIVVDGIMVVIGDGDRWSVVVYSGRGGY